MVIRKGQEWAEPASRELIETSTPAANDAELAALAWQAQKSGEYLTASPGDGDVLKTLGLEKARTDDSAMVYSWDLGLAELHQGDAIHSVPFVSHLVLRSRTGLGQLVCIMNTPWYGRYRLGPKAHPNDGLLDITYGRLPIGQLLQARRRAPTGMHLPHPALRTTRAAEWDMSFERDMVTLVDRSSVDAVRRLRISLTPDAFSIVA